MASLYWINEALAGLLPTLWMSFGVGLPWALALLSTDRWRSRALVVALALATGPALMTAWMLVLGVAGAQTEQRLLTPVWILCGSLLIAALGTWIAWKKGKNRQRSPATKVPYALDEKLIIILIAIALLLRWVHTAFWTFTAYDALWVYGFQGRLYFLEGMLPRSIDYYPQFLQLQFAYVQIVISAINDHAARMALPMLHLGSVLAAFLLGEMLVNRRVGLFLAALWCLHPFVGQWSTIGDLEIPLAFAFTLSAAFFLRAWLDKDDERARRRDALIAGFLLGIALFTKPTAGGFVWGVFLLLGVEAARTRLVWRDLKPRFTVAFWTGVACLPLGGIWYLRNFLLGHEVITWPADVWLTLARRSGDFLSWPALAIVVMFLGVAVTRRMTVRRLAMGCIGVALLLAGLLAANPGLFPERFDPPGSHVRLEEAIAVVAGLALIGISLRPHQRPPGTMEHKLLGITGWSSLLALPYFVTFFLSYSYHYRLGFAIVPLMIMPTAIALGHIVTSERIHAWRPYLRRSYYLLLALLAMPGLIAVAVDVNWSRVWLGDDRLDNPQSKYQVFNPSLMEMVFGLNEFLLESEIEPLVLAPGEERLHFFFPQMAIVDSQLQTLDEFEQSGATHMIYGAKARQAYLHAGIDPQQTQLVAALGRRDFFDLKKWHYQGTFSYELYQSDDLSKRHQPPRRSDIPHIHSGTEIVFGDHLRLLADGSYPPLILKETPITLQTAWQILKPIESDYRFVLELINQDTETAEYQWTFALAEHRHGYYSTAIWDTNETVSDTHVFRFAEDSNLPAGSNYVMQLRVTDPAREQTLPLTVDGKPSGDYWRLAGRHTIGP